MSKKLHELSRLEMSPADRSCLRFILFAGVDTIVLTALELYGMVVIIPDISQTLRCYQGN